MEGLKFCRKCNTWKHPDEFYKSVRGGCKDCVRKYQNEWSQKHRVHKRLVVPGGFRLCKRCGETKPLDDFYRDKSNVSGYHHYCKVCVDATRKARREKAKKPKLELPEGHKRCSKCKQVLSLERFSRLGDGYKSSCKDCDRLYKQTHREQRRESERKRLSQPDARAARLAYRKEWRSRPEARAKEIEYRKAHPTKKAKRVRVRELVEKPILSPEVLPDEHFTSTQWRKLLDLCNWSCVLCGSQFELSRDHIIPQSWGGSDKIANIQPLCRKHNMQKNDCYAVDYRPSHVRAWSYEQTYGTLDEGMVFDEQAALEWWVKLQAVSMGVDNV